jgi:hypothetical protein
VYVVVQVLCDSLSLSLSLSLSPFYSAHTTTVSFSSTHASFSHTAQQRKTPLTNPTGVWGAWSQPPDTHAE